MSQRVRGVSVRSSGDRFPPATLTIADLAHVMKSSSEALNEDETLCPNSSSLGAREPALTNASLRYGSRWHRVRARSP